VRREARASTHLPLLPYPLPLCPSPLAIWPSPRMMEESPISLVRPDSAHRLSTGKSLMKAVVLATAATLAIAGSAVIASKRSRRRPCPRARADGGHPVGGKWVVEKEGTRLVTRRQVDRCRLRRPILRGRTDIFGNREPTTARR